MNALEAKILPPHSDESVDPTKYWEDLADYLSESGLSKTDHALIMFSRWDHEIDVMPDSLFSPTGAEGSRLRDTHGVLKAIINQPPQAWTEQAIVDVFPHWHFQLNEALDYLDYVDERP